MVRVTRIEPEATGLVVRAEPIDTSVDLLAQHRPGSGFFFERDGAGVAGDGVAATVSVPAGPGQVRRAAELAERALARVRREGPGDVEPVVVGALPFDGLSPATLAIPRTAVIRRRDGTAWRIAAAAHQAELEGEDEVDGPGEAGGDGRLPRPLAVIPMPEPALYLDAVARARERIAAGSIEKVVLARMLIARMEEHIDRRALLARLRSAEPDAYVFSVHGFLGASPELLVARARDEVRSNPLAGTATRHADPDDDAAAGRGLLASGKDRREHAFVVDAVRDALAETCLSLDVDREPTVVPTGQVWHLSTSVRGRLRPPLPSALSLAAGLHPTPAVCGVPTDRALEAISDLERIDRTLYAGLVGWMDASGDGEWAIVLRCAEVQGRIALLFAGAGITADSDPEAELAETDAKFRSMLLALGWSGGRVR